MSANKISKISMIVDASQAKAEYGALTAEASGFSKATASSGVMAQASLTQIEQAQRRVVSSSGQMAASASLAAKSEQQLAITAAEAAAANQALVAAQTELATSSQAAAAATLLVAEAEQAGSVSAAQLAAAQTIVAAEHELSAGKIIKTAVAIDKLGGVAISGGKAIGTLAGAFSAMSLGTLALIAGIALLIGWILQRIKHEHELLEINQEGLKLDLARANTTHGQQELTKDLTTLLLRYKQVSEDLVAAEAKETEGHYAVERAVEDRLKGEAALTHMMAEEQPVMNAHNFFFDSAAEKQGKLTKKRQDDEVELHKTIDALIQFAQSSGQATDQILRQARAVGVAGKALEDLTTELTGAAFAQRRLSEAVQDAKAPKVDYTKSREVALALGESVKSGMGEAAAAGVKKFDDQVRMNHESLEKQVKALKDHTLATGDLTAENLKAVLRFRQLEETHKSGAGALRSYANELINLKARAEDARSALEGDSFTVRDQRITTAANREREHLEVDKKNKFAAMQAIADRENFEHQRVANDKVRAEQMVAVEIARIHVGGIKDEQERTRALLDIEIALRSKALVEEFGDTRQTQIMIANFKVAKLEEFNRWEKETNAKHWREQREIRVEEELRANKEIEAARKKLLIEQRQTRVEQTQRSQDQFAGQFTSRQTGIGQQSFVDPQSVARLQQLQRLLQQSGMSAQQFDRALQVVDHDLDRFERLMLRSAQFNRGNFFGGLIGSIKDVGKEFIESGAMGQAWAQAIVGAFDLTINSGANFVSAFGKLLLGGMFQVFGQMAITSGSYHVAEGIARMATIWDFAGGAREFAAGTALIAFGAALGAAGSAISSSARPSSGGGGASVAGSSGSGGSTTADTSGPRQPTLINVPTSAGRDQTAQRLVQGQRDLAVQRANREAVSQRQAVSGDGGPVQVMIQLGPDAGPKFLNDLIQGRGMITAKNAAGRYRGQLQRTTQRKSYLR